MTDSAKLDLLLESVGQISTKVNCLDEHTDERMKCIEQRMEHMDERMKHIEQRTGHMDEHMKRMDERMTCIEQRTGHMDECMRHIEQRVDHMDERMKHFEQRVDHMDEHMKRIEQRMTHVEQKIIDIKVHLENRTDKNIQLLAENFIDLTNKLNQAIPAANKNLAYEVKVNYLIGEVDKLKEKVEKIAKKTA